MIRRPVTGPRAARWAVRLNALIIALLVLAVVIAETGGFRETWFGIIVSIKRASRLVILAGALWVIRWWFAPRYPVFGWWFTPRRSEPGITERGGPGWQRLSPHP